MKKSKNEVVTILNQKGEVLYGILTSPAKEVRSGVIIIFCQAGLAIKSGVGNQFRLMCDNMASRCHVLRFDQSGTGDSQGSVAADILMNDFFLMVMRGCFVDDTVSVIEWVRENFSEFKIILMGQCGGCLTAAYAGSRYIDDIHAYIMLAPPVLYLPETNQKKSSVRSFDANIILRMYFKKLFSLKSYMNFFRGKSDLYLLYNSFLSVVKNRLSCRVLKKSVCTHERFNQMFWDAFQIIVKKERKILFIFPEMDNETYDFNTEFKPLITQYISSGLVSLEYVPESEHSLMFKKHRLYVDDVLDRWLDMFCSVTT